MTDHDYARLLRRRRLERLLRRLGCRRATTIRWARRLERYAFFA